jgi:penicillin-binding protein 2
MNKYRVKHEVLTHISDAAFNAVMDGMEAVVTHGTARNARIENIQVCAKTGTAEKYTILDGQRIKLENNAMFVAFAPKENPKIAIAVVVENAGYGGTWGGPIARILMEKYLNDSLTKESKADYERVSTTNKMPKHLGRLQYKEDSIRARKWFEMTKDSSYIKKYTRIKSSKTPAPQKELPSKPKRPDLVAVMSNEKSLHQQRPYFVPLHESA